MFIECQVCHSFYDDEYRDSICPHRGIGYCEICDGAICFSPERCNAMRERRMKAMAVEICPNCNKVYNLADHDPACPHGPKSQAAAAPQTNASTADTQAPVVQESK